MPTINDTIPVKPTTRKRATAVKNSTQESKQQNIYNLIKLLLLNLFITPLVFFLIVFLYQETLNILSTLVKEDLNISSSSIFCDFLFKITFYNLDFQKPNIYVLFYRWSFICYMVFVIAYNIRALIIYDKIKNKEI